MFSLLRRLILHIFDRFIIYPLMSWALCSKATPITFMNLGYWPIDEKDEAIKKKIQSTCKSNERDLPHYYLYEKCLSAHPKYPNLHNMKVIEIGAGNGSGIDWMKRAHPELADIQGIDKIGPSHREVKQADAGCLPFPEKMFDLAVNVESSHLYGNEEKFLKECYRVLKPNGHLCLVDIRYQEKIVQLRDNAQCQGLINDTAADITQGVLEGIERTTKNYDELLRKAPLIVRLFAPLLRSTYCAPGTEPYQRLKERIKVYYAMSFKKI